MVNEKWLIDANATIAEAEKRRDLYQKGSRARDSYNAIIGFIKYNSSTVDAVEVVHGKWEWKPQNEMLWNLRCSVCGSEDGACEEYNYCPNCGAKMDGGNGDE